MVAERNNIHAGLEKSIEDLWRQSAAAGGVFGVTNDKINSVLANQPLKVLDQNTSTGLANHVPDT